MALPRIISHYKVFIQPLTGAEFQAGITNNDSLVVIDGFLLCTHKDNGCIVGFNAQHVAWYRLDPELLDHATKNA
ncbi:hypothetical protein DES37_12913 [Mangrovibacter plantisponsor]|uniref:Uncharacterized protein n=1 Tax=Mangrovibacter plantisponsor TaxID=451513 RepID=A0A317PIA2_9ENTR|nr:hypothetical protein DES37_12913 [Mangrovibacter plantisponsor]